MNEQSETGATPHFKGFLGILVTTIFVMPFVFIAGHFFNPTGPMESALALGAAFIAGTAFLVLLSLIGGKND